MKTTKIKGKFVIGHDGQSHVIYRDGEVVYKGEEIIFTGKNYGGAADEVFDTGLSIISPGFIDLNADIDTDHALIDVAHPAKEQDRFKMNDKREAGDPYTDDDFRIRQTYSIAQLIRNGVTTAMPIEGETFHSWGQTYREHEIMAEVALSLGMRLYAGPSFRSFSGVGTGYDEKRSEQSFADALRFYEDFDGKGDGLIRAFLNPCQIRWTAEDILLRAIRFAEEKNAPMRLHACEGAYEWDYIKTLGGKTTIQYFDKIGLLSKNLLIPHATAALDSELELLARNKVSVISTPCAEMNWAGALVSFAKYRHYGINLTLGSDCQPVDMIQNMKIARGVDALFRSRQIFNRYCEDGSIKNLADGEPVYKRMGEADFFDAATVNGARALGRDDIGRLAPGAKADIIAVNLNDISVGPYEDPIRTLIFACTGSNVSHTIINGKILMKDKKLLYIDENALMENAQKVYERFLNFHEQFDLYKRPKETFFPPTYKFAG